MPQTSPESLPSPTRETGNHDDRQSKTFLQRYLIGTIKAFLGFTHLARSNGNIKRQQEKVTVQESERLPSQNIANVISNLNNSEASLSRSGGDYGSQPEAPVILPINHSSFGEEPEQTIIQAGKHEAQVSECIKLRADSSERFEHSIDSRMQPVRRTSSKQNSIDLPIESKEGQHSNPISDARALDTAVMSKSTMNSPVDRSPALQANEKQHSEIASAVNPSQLDESNLIVTSPTTPGSATIDSASLTPSAQRSHSLPDEKLHAFTTTERPRLQPRHSHTVPTNTAGSDEDFGAYGGSRERVLGGDEEKESLSSPIQQSSGAPTRPHIVPDITGRVKKTTKLPIFEGTYSNVYKGEFEGLKVAIKDLRTVKNAQAMQRKLRREVETWWHLTHENILPLLGYIQDDEYGPYGALVSPWCEHGDAGVFLTRKQTPRQRVSMFQDVSLGIQYLHSFYPTIVHGDLKPTNVLIDENLTAKLCDFGLVRLIQDEMVTGMTTTAYTGTTRYLSYELVASEEEALPTTASDIYALACLGMEFIYSHPPYAHIHPNAPRAPLKICREIEIGKPPAHRPVGIDGALSDLWDLFEACWDLDATKRPTADDVCAFLERSGQNIIDHLEQ